MAQVTTYHCPSCTAPLHFSSKSGKLECDYCGSSYDVSQIDNHFEQKIKDAETETEKKQEENEEKWDATGMHSYTCSSCGAEIICEVNTVATSCPYCANNTVIPGQFTGGRKPDYVIPFSIDKKTAIEGLKKHYENKKLLPSVFASQNHIQDIKGIYVPFWLFDGEVDIEMKIHGTKTSVSRTKDEEVVSTAHYSIFRKMFVPFEKVPVDASKNISNDLMDSVEPFDYSKLTKFTPSYLPGFLAEAYDENADECKPRFDFRAENSAIAEVFRTIAGYDSTNIVAKRVDIKHKGHKYAFLPVWILTTKWQDKLFMFAMNGQTGKFVGNLPISWGKFWAYFISIFAGIGSVVSFIAYLFMNGGV